MPIQTVELRRILRAAVDARITAIGCVERAYTPRLKYPDAKRLIAILGVGAGDGTATRVGPLEARPAALPLLAVVA